MPCTTRRRDAPSCHPLPEEREDLPYPVIPAAPAQENGTVVMDYLVRYDEDPEVGYKWYEVKHKQPLFACGFGMSYMSYTSYAYSGLTVDSTAKAVRFTVKNSGKRAGAEIAAVYARLPKDADESFKRLVGWSRITLAPGESQTLTVAIDPRVLQTFDEAHECWNLTPGDYEIFAGPSSDNTPLSGTLCVH